MHITLEKKHLETFLFSPWKYLEIDNKLHN